MSSDYPRLEQPSPFEFAPSITTNNTASADGPYVYQPPCGLQATSARILTLESALRKAVEAAETMFGRLETCHICKASLIFPDSPAHCEDCSYDCDGHDEPACDLSLFVETRKLLAEAKAALEDGK